MSAIDQLGPHFKGNRIYQMDCLAGMPLLSALRVDLILTDLPYGKTGNLWDSIIDLDRLWQQYKRIIRLPRYAIALTAQCPFDKLLGMSNRSWLKCEWAWEKSRATGYVHAKHENFLVFYKGLPPYHSQFTKRKPYVTRNSDRFERNFGKVVGGVVTINNGFRYPRTVLKFPSEGKPFDPTQKPDTLFEYLIRNYTNPGDLVLDSCIGSCTTAIACLNTNRQFIGFELDAEFCAFAIQRINRHRSELTKP
jgi:site-specific DNA-methyltransferase (adenine-specific)